MINTPTIPIKVARPLGIGEKSVSKVHEQLQRRQQPKCMHEPSSSLPLQTLVALASTLFDENALKEKQQARQEKQCFEMDRKNKNEIQKERVSTKSQSKRQKIEASSISTSRHEMKTKKMQLYTGCHTKSPVQTNTSTIQQTNFQCCTRQGFLSRLRSVLNDTSHSNVLSWMPDGKAFTIVSSRKFAKSGLVYDLFGIRKMSSFLRRLNQLGFARVRDPTDPQNLDVFRKPGFVASPVEKVALAGTTFMVNQKSVTITNAKTARRLDSPTSTLLFAHETKEGISRDLTILPQTEISQVAMVPRISTTVGFSTTTVDETRSRSSSVGTELSSSSTLSSWTCLTPKPGHLEKTQPVEMSRLPYVPSALIGAKSIDYPSLPMTSMPPHIPASSSDGPVLLRARSESYDRSFSTPPSEIVFSMLPPRPVLFRSVTDRETPLIANKRSLELSPGTVRNLELPNLKHLSQRESSITYAPVLTTTVTRTGPPPLEFVAECVRQLMSHPSEPVVQMEITDSSKETKQRDENNNQMINNMLPNIHHPATHSKMHMYRHPKLQHQREYLSLYRAAESEADAILNGMEHTSSESVSSTLEPLTKDEEFPSQEKALEASIMLDIKLLQQHHFR